jgi:hypothetical protein
LVRPLLVRTKRGFLVTFSCLKIVLGVDVPFECCLSHKMKDKRKIVITGSSPVQDVTDRSRCFASVPVAGIDHPALLWICLQHLILMLEAHWTESDQSVTLSVLYCSSARLLLQ